MLTMRLMLAQRQCLRLAQELRVELPLVGGIRGTKKNLEKVLSEYPQEFGNKTNYVLAGGWAVELISGQARSHKDIDIIVLNEDFDVETDNQNPESYFGQLSVPCWEFAESFTTAIPIYWTNLDLSNEVVYGNNLAIIEEFQYDFLKEIDDINDEVKRFYDDEKFHIDQFVDEDETEDEGDWEEVDDSANFKDKFRVDDSNSLNALVDVVGAISCIDQVVVAAPEFLTIGKLSGGWEGQEAREEDIADSLALLRTGPLIKYPIMNASLVRSTFNSLIGFPVQQVDEFTKRFMALSKNVWKHPPSTAEKMTIEFHNRLRDAIANNREGGTIER